MNKRLIVLAVAGAFGASGAAIAAPKDMGPSASVHGFVESLLVVSDDAGDVPGGDNTTEKKFATEGEVSLHANATDDVYVRVDLDYNSRYSAGGETLEIEQLYGAWRINDMAKMKVGRFNNPLGYEAQDAPYKSTISRSLIMSLLDDQTSLYQNNIEGVAVGLNVGPAMVTLGVLNEIGGVVDEENSFLAHVRGEVIPGLNLGLGMLTQEDFDAAANPNSFETLINFNADYTVDFGAAAAKFFVDYLTAGEGLDMAYSLGAKVQVVDNVGVTFRYDFAEYDSDREDTAMTLAANWNATDNVDFRAEWRNDEVENAGAANRDDDSVVLSAVFTF